MILVLNVALERLWPRKIWMSAVPNGSEASPNGTADINLFFPTTVNFRVNEGTKSPFVMIPNCRNQRRCETRYADHLFFASVSNWITT